MSSEKIIFVVHTDSYSGNFEREMCAYMTGQVGDCGVGEDLASDFLEEVDEETVSLFEDIVEQTRDDNGFARPCAIFPTPGRLNDGNGKHYDAEPGETGYPAYESVAIYFNEVPSDEIILLLKDRAVKYAVEQYNRRSYHKDRASLIINGFELIRETTEVKQVRTAV